MFVNSQDCGNEKRDTASYWFIYPPAIENLNNLTLLGSIHGSPLPQQQFVPSILPSNLQTSRSWLPW